jgi:hypothetical protein
VQEECEQQEHDRGADYYDVHLFLDFSLLLLLISELVYLLHKILDHLLFRVRDLFYEFMLVLNRISHVIIRLVQTIHIHILLIVIVIDVYIIRRMT